MQVIVCVILTAEVQVVAQPSGLSDSDEDALLGVNASSTALVVWSAHNWFVYNLGGLLLSTAQMTSVNAHILAIDVHVDEDDFGGHRLRITWKTAEHGIVVADSNTLRLRLRPSQCSHDVRLQSNVIALSRHRQLVYMMMMMVVVVMVVVVVLVVLLVVVVVMVVVLVVVVVMVVVVVVQ